MPRVTQTKPGQSKNQTSVLDRISAIGFDKSDGIKMLLYGRSGTGKTTLWGTFPDPILAIICSGGKRSGELRSIDTPANRKRIDQVILSHPEELRVLTEALERPKERLGKDYQTIVLDHVSGFQDMVLADILGLDELPEQRSWGMAAREQYGQCTTQCKDYLSKLYGVRMNLVVVAHEREFESEVKSDVVLPHVGAGVLPSLAGWLNGASDYICQTYIRQKEVLKTTTVVDPGKPPRKVQKKVKTEEVEYCLRTYANTTFMTRFRVPKGTKLPLCIVDPDYDKIIALIRGVDIQSTRSGEGEVDARTAG